MLLAGAIENYSQGFGRGSPGIGRQSSIARKFGWATCIVSENVAKHCTAMDFQPFSALNLFPNLAMLARRQSI